MALDIEAIRALKARYCWYCDDPEVHHRFDEGLVEHLTLFDNL